MIHLDIHKCLDVVNEISMGIIYLTKGDSIITG